METRLNSGKTEGLLLQKEKVKLTLSKVLKKYYKSYFVTIVFGAC